jgi:hypothetical protein
MKIVWRNPNLINRTSFSIVKTLAVEQPDELRCSIAAPRAQGHLAPYPSYSSIVTRSLVRHDSSVHHSVSFSMPRLRITVRPDLSPAFASQEGQQEGIAIEMQRHSVVREDV